MYYLILITAILFFTFRKCGSRLVVNLMNSYKKYKNLHLNDPTLSYRLVYDFVIFKLRELSSYYLEIGYMSYENGLYDLVYYYNGTQRYRLKFPKQKRYISYVINNNDEDISDEFFEYLGPGNNFYAIPTTPEMLSINEPIIVGYFDGTQNYEKKYLPNEIIQTYC